MPLPSTIRRVVPDRVRDSERLRAFALGSGLIPPRPMHTAGEAALLVRLATDRSTVVELGTYEGSSAVVLCSALGPSATLHLVDSYEGNALRFGWRGTASATQRLVARAARDGGPQIEWWVMRTGAAARAWTHGPTIELLFIDADHTAEGCRADWDAWNGHVAPGGVVAFHDARMGHPGGGERLPGPTAVVDELFRGPNAIADWRIVDEVDSVVVVERIAPEAS